MEKEALWIVVLLILAAPSYSRDFTGGGTAEVEIHYDDYFLRCVPDQPVIYGEAGETVEFKVYFRRGDDKFIYHDVGIVDDDDNFVFTTDPETIPQVRNVDMVPMKVTLLIPEGKEDGTYDLKVLIRAKEFQPTYYPLDLKIKVGKSNVELMRYALLLISIVLVMVVGWRTTIIKTRSL